jgi:hypothetical protein
VTPSPSLTVALASRSTSVNSPAGSLAANSIWGYGSIIECAVCENRYQLSGDESGNYWGRIYTKGDPSE